jgi:hypothetical protein
MQNSQSHGPFVDRQGAAKYRSISIRKTDQLSREGKIQESRIGRKPVFRVADSKPASWLSTNEQVRLLEMLQELVQQIREPASSARAFLPVSPEELRRVRSTELGIPQSDRIMFVSEEGASPPTNTWPNAVWNFNERWKRSCESGHDYSLVARMEYGIENGGISGFCRLDYLRIVEPESGCVELILVSKGQISFLDKVLYKGSDENDPSKERSEESAIEFLRSRRPFRILQNYENLAKTQLMTCLDSWIGALNKSLKARARNGNRNLPTIHDRVTEPPKKSAQETLKAARTKTLQGFIEDAKVYKRYERAKQANRKLTLRQFAARPPVIDRIVQLQSRYHRYTSRGWTLDNVQKALKKKLADQDS